MCIRDRLEEMGVHIGVPISSIDTHRIRWRILQLQPNMTYFALNIHGNSVTVLASGAEPPEAILDQDAVTKVVAKRDGVVRTVHALDGQAVVQMCIRDSITTEYSLASPYSA